MTSASIIEAAIAGYAGIVSTLSLILALRAYRAGGPIVDVTWAYFDDKQELMLIVTNKGRADVTVFDIDLSIVRHRITRQLGKAFDLEMTSRAHRAKTVVCESKSKFSGQASL
jgi:hypothetical protein